MNHPTENQIKEAWSTLNRLAELDGVVGDLWAGLKEGQRCLELMMHGLYGDEAWARIGRPDTTR